MEIGKLKGNLLNFIVHHIIACFTEYNGLNE